MGVRFGEEGEPCYECDDLRAEVERLRTKCTCEGKLSGGHHYSECPRSEPYKNEVQQLQEALRRVVEALNSLLDRFEHQICDCSSDYVSILDHHKKSCAFSKLRALAFAKGVMGGNDEAVLGD